MTLSEVILVWQLFNFPNGFVLGKIIIPEVIFWFGLVKITSGIIIIPNTNLFGKLNNYQTKITSDKVILVIHNVHEATLTTKLSKIKSIIKFPNACPIEKDKFHLAFYYSPGSKL